MAGDESPETFDTATVVAVQRKAMEDIADIILPWMAQKVVSTPMPLKIINHTVGNQHVTLAIENGQLEITLNTRELNPPSDVMVIAPEEEKSIDLTAR